MSQIKDWDCAMFISQQQSANIKASARGSSWKFRKRSSQVEAPAINVVETRGQTFSGARLTYSRLNQTIGMKNHSIDVCPKTTQKYGNWKTANCAQLWKQRPSTLYHIVCSVLKKHLLQKARNLSLPTLYNLFKLRSLFLLLLKVAFFARQKSQTAINNSIFCIFAKRFKISWKAINSWSPKFTAIKTMPFLSAILSKMMRTHQNMTFVNVQSKYFLKNSNSEINEPKPFVL